MLKELKRALLSDSATNDRLAAWPTFEEAHEDANEEVDQLVLVDNVGTDDQTILLEILHNFFALARPPVQSCHVNAILVKHL